MLDLRSLGATGQAAPGGVDAKFVLLLPGLPAGCTVDVLLIHRDDRFDQHVPAQRFSLTGGADGRWRADVRIQPKDGTSFGRPGRYLYRFQLLDGAGEVVVDWFTDPFARRTDDAGQLSAFDADPLPDFAWHDDEWKVPELDELVVYELHVGEFNRDFAGVVDRLPYLKSLGVTCLELMPVTSVKLDFDWGYGPIHYFAPSERWGGALGLKRLVDACHAAGVAVILDVVYQHVDPSFPYCLVYRTAGKPSPMIDGDGQFGPLIDFDQQLAKDYVQAVNRYWLEEFHVDGFRYDEVTDLYDTPVGRYATIAYDVYDRSLTIPRFTPSGGTQPGEYSRVIQCAEALWKARTVLTETFTAAAWQDDLLGRAESEVGTGRVDAGLVGSLDVAASGYPATKTVHDINGDGVEMPVWPFQYINSHDHSHLIAFAAGAPAGGSTPLADRGRWFTVQPWVIALYTAQGVPMLWQGQEVTDNWVLAPSGDLRVHIRREFHWEYFYDREGAPLARLHRIMGNLRATTPALRSRHSQAFSDASRPQDGLVAYARGATGEALVVLNFSDAARSIALPAPQPGSYVEQVDADVRPAPLELPAAAADDPLEVTVPSHYGYVLIRV